MRITVVTTSYPEQDGDPGGHFVQVEVRELEALGHRVTVVTPVPGGAFGWPGLAARMRANPLRAFEAFGWAARGLKAIRASRPDRVVAHWAVPCGVMAAVACKAPLELVSHGGDVRLLTHVPGRERIVARLVERATSWRFVSQALLDQLTSSLSSELSESVRVLAVVAPSPIELYDVTVAAKEVRTAHADRRLFVCAGRLVKTKRIDKVIDHVASLPKPGGRLVVIGDGPERRHLELLASRWNLDARFLGTVSRQVTLTWIGAADEVLHASQAEGLSTVVREAIGLGVKVTLL